MSFPTTTGKHFAANDCIDSLLVCQGRTQNVSQKGKVEKWGKNDFCKPDTTHMAPKRSRKMTQKIYQRELHVIF